MRTLLLSAWTALLLGCSAPLEQTRPASHRFTLDAAGSGQAGYFCRRAICAGDDGQNNPVRGLVQFDLQGLSPTTPLQSAVLRLYQGEATRAYAALGPLLVEHIRSAQLSDPAAFDAPALASYPNRTSAEGFIEIDVTEALRSELFHGRPLAQFRLRFSTPTDHDNQSDLALFSAAEGYAPQLVLRLGHP